jgi:hypothetical protein
MGPAPIRFIPPTVQAAPSRGRSRGGASRGQCMAGNQPLTALVPSEGSNQLQGAAAIGLTTASHPTFWFYVPTALTPDRPAEFLLLDADGNYLHTTLLTGTPTDGIVQVTLPTTAAPLATGQTYRWALQLLCETGDAVDVWGEIQRVDLPSALQSQLATASTRDRAALYAAHGIWYDALTTLAELRRSDPDNTPIAADWQSLLQSVNLPNVANAPLLSCCEADRSLE